MKFLKTISLAFGCFLLMTFAGAVFHQVQFSPSAFAQASPPTTPATTPASGTPTPKTPPASASAGGVPLSYSIDEANLGDGPNGFDINHTGMERVEDFSTRIIRFLTGVVVLITIFVFMVGAGHWTFSAGNESLVGKGKDMMLYSILGLLLVLGSYVLVKLMQVILYALGT